MAQKKITDLQLISAVTDDLSLPADDTIQTYRTTIAQIKAWILAANNVVTATINNLAVTTGKLADGAVTDVKTSFTKPTIQKFLSGSGTYTLPANCKYIQVEMLGGGGGGAGGGTTNVAGSTGVASTFGSTIVVANPGTGASNYTPGTGGTASLGAGAEGLIVTGGGGQSGGATDAAVSWAIPGMGGSSALGGAGGSIIIGVGGAGRSNSGGGGGGGGGGAAGANRLGGGGGGAGGYAKAIIASPASTYAYVVGTGGAAGGAGGGSGSAGGAGADGQIVVTEYYQ
jgi:hypothetical protein